MHDPRVKLGRIQNFKNWSPDMVPDPRQTCLGLEYFCFEGDGLWTMSDEDLVRLGRREIAEIGLLGGGKVIDGTVVRMPKAYPVYDEGFKDALAVVRDYLDGFSNLQVAGRNGMHKYNNQDHSMVTAHAGRAEPARRASRRLGRQRRRRVSRGSRTSRTSTKDLPELEATQPRVPAPSPAATRSLTSQYTGVTLTRAEIRLSLLPFSSRNGTNPAVARHRERVQ